MFRSKTLFVLGAGASFEAGLPTGELLKEQIASKIDIRFDTWGDKQEYGDQQVWRVMTQVADQKGKTHQQFLDQAKQLKAAMPLAISIDNLLDAHRGDEIAEVCGKLGIVKCIQEAESRSKLFIDHNSTPYNFNRIQGAWYPEFSRVVTEGVARSELEDIFSNVSIISFNYDRCFEHFIYHALQTYYGVTEDESKEAIKKLKIFHPYGQIGKLPWQEGSLPIHKFGDERINLLDVFKQIKTFNERVREEEEILKIRQAVQEAELIVFLGFAFHKQNLELLNPSTKCNAKRVLATGFGLSKSDCDVIEEDLNKILDQGITPNPPRIIIRNDLKCAELFKEFTRTLQS
jgi:hypothetical protein